MNNYVLTWGYVTLPVGHMIANKETLVPHIVATLTYLSQDNLYHISGDRSPLGRAEDHSVTIACCLSWAVTAFSLYIILLTYSVRGPTLDVRF